MHYIKHIYAHFQIFAAHSVTLFGSILFIIISVIHYVIHADILSTFFLYRHILWYIYCGINETKQCELELLMSCLLNHSANLQL